MKDYNQFLYQLKLLFAYHDVVRGHVPFFFKRMVKNYRRYFLQSLKHLKEKKTLNVAFFLTIPGMWKADYLFKLMAQSPQYNPYIVILPYSSFKGFNEEENLSTLKKTEKFIQNKGFRYVIPYDAKKKQWIDIKKTLNPDIVFYSSPYKDNLPQYYIYHYKDVPTFYIPYGFTSMNCYETNYNLIFPNIVGCNLVETNMHLDFARKYGRSNGKNYAVVGCPGAEVYLRDDYTPRDVWKPQSHPKKRVIWAPHHSIDAEGGLDVSTFLLYSEYMLSLAETYQDFIQFAFKPHQTLRYKLNLLWGVEKTTTYYNKWQKLSNGQLEEAGYIDLFMTSDAMIHDSGSFTTEYLYVGKPVMYLVKNNNIRNQFNEFGIKAFECHYHGHNENELNFFLHNVVLDGIDPMAEQRHVFFTEYLKPKDGLLPSEQILHLLERFIKEEQL